MVKQCCQLTLMLFIFTLSACTVTATQRVPTATVEPTSPPEQTFLDALHRRISQEKIVPDFSRLEISPLYVKKPTLAFPENQGIVLQLNLFGFPDAKRTQQLVVPLIEVGAKVAAGHEISLSGIEVAFHWRDTYGPMLVWANTPPWDADQIFLAPPK